MDGAWSRPTSDGSNEIIMISALLIITVLLGLFYYSYTPHGWTSIHYKFTHIRIIRIIFKSSFTSLKL